MRTDFGRTRAKARSEQRDWDDICKDAGVVGLVDALCVICLLSRIAAVRPLIRNRDDDLGGVRIPAVVEDGWRVGCIAHPTCGVAP